MIRKSLLIALYFGKINMKKKKRCAGEAAVPNKEAFAPPSRSLPITITAWATSSVAVRPKCLSEYSLDLDLCRIKLI